MTEQTKHGGRSGGHDLDSDLEETFPASDPVSIVQPQPRRRKKHDEETAVKHGGAKSRAHSKHHDD